MKPSAPRKPRFVYLLHVAQRRLHAFIQSETDGQTAARAGLLMALSADEATPMSKLGPALDLAAPAISNLVERASQAGLVRRRPSPEDGRAWMVELTSAGRAARQEAVRHARTLNARLSDGFTDEELAIVERWLVAVRERFTRPE